MTDQQRLSILGADMDEVIHAQNSAQSWLSTDEQLWASRILCRAYPQTEEKIRSSLVAGWIHFLSEAGRAVLIQGGTDRSLAALYEEVFASPLHLRTVSRWCLQFALRAAASEVQLRHCVLPSLEGHLNGALLQALSTACREWSGHVRRTLARTREVIEVQRIDLSLGGGEQVTGATSG